MARAPHRQDEKKLTPEARQNHREPLLVAAVASVSLW